MTLRSIFLLALFIPSLPLCFIRPLYGISLWTIVAFLNPQAYTWQAWVFPWAVAVAIPTILGFNIFSRGWDRLITRDTVPLLILWVWFVITTIVSINTPLFSDHATDALAKLTMVSKILLMTFVTIGVIDSFARLRTLVLVIAGCFGVFVIKGFPFLFLSGGEFRMYGPPNSMIADNNDFGLALNMTLPLFFFLAQCETKPWLKRVFWTLFVLTIPVILFTYSRGALVGLTAILGLMFLRLKQRLILAPAIIIAILAVLLFAPDKWKERMNFSRDGAVMDKSAQSRINAWTFSWRLASDYPLTGGGFETFTKDLFARYAPNTQDIHGPHSIYFGVLAEHGFPGLILYLMVVGACFWQTGRVAKWARIYGDETALNYANMFRFNLTGFLMSGLFLGRAYFDYFFAIAACIVVLKRVSFQAWAEHGTEEADDEYDALDAPQVAEAT